MAMEICVAVILSDNPLVISIIPTEKVRVRLCTNGTCNCHIGYVHLDYLELDKVFGERILERIPIATNGSVFYSPVVYKRGV